MNLVADPAGVPLFGVAGIGIIPIPESSNLSLIADRVGKAGFPYALPPVKTYWLWYYLIGRMLMLREKLSVQQWHVYDRSAEAICNQILSRLPADNPDSAVWDNRRKGSQGTLR